MKGFRQGWFRSDFYLKRIYDDYHKQTAQCMRLPPLWGMGGSKARHVDSNNINTDSNSYFLNLGQKSIVLLVSWRVTISSTQTLGLMIRMGWPLSCPQMVACWNEAVKCFFFYGNKATQHNIPNISFSDLWLCLCHLHDNKWWSIISSVHPQTCHNKFQIKYEVNIN